MENVKERIHEDFEKLKQNKEEHFDEFYKNNYNLVYRICFSILKNKENSEDVAQTVFEKIYKLPNEKIASSYESTWLYTVTKNEAIQYLRKSKFSLPLDENLNELESGKNEIRTIEESEDYKKLVKKLNKKQEQIVSLKVLSDFTFKEIGEMLSMPTATVQWHYYSSIKSLRLAIGNLAMFIIAFILGFKLWFKVDKNEDNRTKSKSVNNSNKQNYETSNEEYENHSPIKGNDTSFIPNSLQETMESTSTDSAYSPTQNYSGIAYIGIFSLASIFLVCSIVFGIMFAKRKKNKQ